MTALLKKHTRNNKLPLHQDYEPEEEEHEEDKQEAEEQEEQEEQEEVIVNDDDDDDNNDDGTSYNEDTTKHCQPIKTRKSRRTKPCGHGYMQEEIETLLSCIHKVIPIGPQEWENMHF